MQIRIHVTVKNVPFLKVLPLPIFNKSKFLKSFQICFLHLCIVIEKWDPFKDPDPVQNIRIRPERIGSTTTILANRYWYTRM